MLRQIKKCKHCNQKQYFDNVVLMKNRLNRYKYQAGFGLIESIIALSLFATFIMWLVHINLINQREKDAKVLAKQTEAFAKVFTHFMNDNHHHIEQMATQTAVILSPQLIQSDWPKDLARINMFHQTPCVAIIRNKTSANLEAIMYYVGGVTDLSANKREIVRNSLAHLGSKGGILFNGVILGNSGWTINKDSPFLAHASQCGGQLSNNSIVINLDLLPSWNQSLHPIRSILRLTDKLSLPGNLQNSNTLKSNIYFATDKGVILNNSTPSNPTKLKVIYEGMGSGAATLGFGTKILSSLVGDSFQPNMQFRSGIHCKAEEVGKIVANEGLNGLTNKYLSRSTLTCTQNDALCGVGAYCYLSSIANNIVFQNNVNGVQDANGVFICPLEVPFALDYKLSNPGGNVYTFLNLGFGAKSYINTLQGTHKGGNATWQTYNCDNCGGANKQPFKIDFSITSDSNELLGIDLGTIYGLPIGSIPTPKGDVTTRFGRIGNYTFAVGYTVSMTNNCEQACFAIGSLTSRNWVPLGQQRQKHTGSRMLIVNPDLGCGCERSDYDALGEDWYRGIAAIKGKFNTMITSVTCSNSPVYHFIN